MAAGESSWHDIVSPLHGRSDNFKRSANNSGSGSGVGTKKRKHSIGSTDTIDSRRNNNVKKSPSDSGDDMESAQASSSTSVAADLHLTPSQIAEIVKEMRSKIQLKKRNMSKKFLTFNDYDCIDLPPGITTEMLKSDLRRCLREATLLSSMTVPAALELIHMFLDDGHSITLDPSFPKRPPNGFAIFMKKSGNSRFSAEGFARWRDKSNAASKEAAEKEALQLMEKYAADLHIYRDQHPELTENHRQYLDKLIVIAERAINKMKGISKAPRVKVNENGKKSGSRKRPKTAFELFAISKAEQYAHLEPERRQKKLLKKFMKLSDEERKIYENLAAAKLQ